MKANDLIGKVFGRLTVIERLQNSQYGQARWRCLCQCGKEAITTTSTLNSGGKISCGCAAFYDLTGRRFGMLEAIRRDENIKEKVSWVCKCDCGKFTSSTTGNLLRGKSASCGCVRTKHNGKGTRLYRIWTGIKTRCLNPNDHAWDRYGGRGISICEEWKDNFGAFQDWAFSHGYDNTLTIDRKENDKGYFPDNCRWITRSENSKKARRENKC